MASAPAKKAEQQRHRLAHYRRGKIRRELIQPDTRRQKPQRGAHPRQKRAFIGQ
ncbi:hypothetical protein CSE899_06102 [Cronobacter sakazakii E899]|nr:hypothetical protein CSE899_06102 [Cronobacter sakazakii E899]